MSTRQCAFIQARACPIDVDEIPLDVCRLCIDAWKTSAEIQTLTGANILGPTIMIPTGPMALQMIPTAPTPQHAPQPQMQPLTLMPKGEGSDSQKILYNLDNDFINDKITADEYVSRRKEIVNQLLVQKDEKNPTMLMKATTDGYLTPEDSMPAGPPRDTYRVINLDENPEMLQGYKKLLPLLIIERKRGKLGITKYPDDWKPPSSLNRSNLESIYNLYDQLREDEEKLLLQFNGTKLGLLGKKNNRILCMVLEGNDKIEDYTEEINSLTDLLKNTIDFDDFLKALPEAMNKAKDLSFN